MMKGGAWVSCDMAVAFVKWALGVKIRCCVTNIPDNKVTRWTFDKTMPAIAANDRMIKVGQWYYCEG